MKRILQIEAAAFPKAPYPRELFRELARDCGDLFLIAKRAGRIIGYIVTCRRKGVAEIISIAVLPDFRGTGAGGVLMRETLRRLVSRGDARVNLTVRVSNQDAIRLYLRFGFRRVRRVPGYYEDGEDGWRMRKILTA